MSTFNEFGLDPAIIAAVEKLGFETATPVQDQTIPAMLDGRDVIAQSRTGSGKTAAFGLPMLERVKDGGKSVRGLVLAPTRELALQVTEALRSFCKKMPIRIVTIYGGSPYPPQLKALRNGAHIVVGTPGRVIDHLDRGSLDLSKVEIFVLDEADEMLRMGFIEPVEHVLEALPKDRQIALFSATMPQPIQRVAKRFMNKPVTVQVEGEALSVDHIEQYWIQVPQRRKLDALIRILQMDPEGATLIFARTRRGCAEMSAALQQRGIAADAIHGDLNQDARERVIHRLRERTLSVLVATDVAARGLDVAHLSRVINVDFPGGSETYVHRIGRTSRAGAKGTAITMVTPAEKRKLHYLQMDIRHDIQQMFPPSAKQLALAQQEVLWQKLESVREETDLTEVKEWLSERRAESGVQPKDIAAAAVQILIQQKGIQLNPPPDPPPGAGRSEGPGRGDFSAVNEVEIFLDIGRHAGVRPQDIVGALANEAGISGTQIGRINLFDKNTMVGLPRALAERILDDFPVMLIRGKEVHLSMGKPGAGGGPPPRRQPKGSFRKPAGEGYRKKSSKFRKSGGGGYPRSRKGKK
jgi:ATP-dependent RNA helicase DeaD